MHVPLERLTVVPVGVDHTVFRPDDDVAKRPGRLMVTSSSDVPMKGLVPLLEAVAKLRVERETSSCRDRQAPARRRVAKAIERLGLGDIVTTISGVTDEELARLYGEAEVAVVPSLYEGFSLPAIEAMSCGVPVVATTGGALPEVVGEPGRTGVLVTPDDPEALVAAIPRPARRPRDARAARRGGPRARDAAVHLAGDRARDGGLLRRDPHGPPAARGDGVRLMLTATTTGSASSPATCSSTSAAGSGATPTRPRAAGPTSSRSTRDATRSTASRSMFAAMVDAGELDDGHAARRHGPGRRARASRSRDATFDRVICSEVLEHLPRRPRGDGASSPACCGPAGTMAVTVPRFGPELVNWALSDEYHDVHGRPHPHLPPPQLLERLRASGLEVTGTGHAHGLHSPYWWLRCAVGTTNEDHAMVRAYHRLLVQGHRRGAALDAARGPGALAGDRQVHRRLPAPARRARSRQRATARAAAVPA